MDEQVAEDIRPVEGFPGYYVGDQGNVYSTWTSGRNAHPDGPMKQLTPVVESGRRQVNLHRDGVQVKRRVHNLVLTTFVGPRPAGMQACHFPDRDTGNNRLSNLRWDTSAANQADKVAHGTTNRGARNGRSRLTVSQVDEIRRRYAGGEPGMTLAAEFGVSPANVSMIVNFRSWANHG